MPHHNTVIPAKAGIQSFATTSGGWKDWMPAFAGMTKGWVTAGCLVMAAPASAETYRVDLIVFLDKYAAPEAGRRFDANLASAIDPANTGALASAGITLLPDDQFALAEEWQHLRNSKRYQPLVKLAWTQKDPPNDRGPAVRVKWGQGFAVGDDQNALAATSTTPVDGSIALLLGHYLHLDVDLVYTTATGAGWRLRENRKMRRDELHHIDGPRLGVIAEVSKPGSPAR